MFCDEFKSTARSTSGAELIVLHVCHKALCIIQMWPERGRETERARPSQAPHPSNQDRARQFFERADANGNGLLSLPELVAARGSGLMGNLYGAYV